MVKNIRKSLIWFAFYYVVSFISAIVTSFVYAVSDIIDKGNDIEDISSVIYDAVYKSAVPSLIIASVICIIAFCIYKISTKEKFDIFTVNWKIAIFCVAIGFVVNCAITFILALVYSFLPTDAVNDLVESTGAVTDVSHSIFVLVLGTGILVPIMEEIVFRYGLHGFISKISLPIAYIISALVFGIAHGNLIQSSYAVVLGLIFSFMFTKGNNLWYPIIIHMTINTASVLLDYIDHSGLLMILLGVIGILLAIIMLFTSKDVRTLFINSKIKSISSTQQIEEQ